MFEYTERHLPDQHAALAGLEEEALEGELGPVRLGPGHDPRVLAVAEHVVGLEDDAAVAGVEHADAGEIGERQLLALAAV